MSQHHLAIVIQPSGTPILYPVLFILPILPSCEVFLARGDGESVVQSVLPVAGWAVALSGYLQFLAFHEYQSWQV